MGFTSGKIPLSAQSTAFGGAIDVSIAISGAVTRSLSHILEMKMGKWSSDKHRSYLGDAVYAEFDGYHVVLTTEDGYRATNRIYLEPQVLQALDRYVKRLIEEAKDDT